MLWFDLDDTIWAMHENSKIVLRNLHSADSGVRAAYGDKSVDSWLEAYLSVNAELWRDYAAGLIKRPFLRVERFARPLRMGGMDGDRANEEANRLDGEYLRQLGLCTGLIDGAREFLEFVRERCMHNGAPLPGILSNGFKEVQYAKLRSSGIEDYFSFIVLSDDLGVNKPDHRIFDYALELSGTEACDSVLVGDNPVTDILGALNAGWKMAIWFNPANKPLPEELDAFTPDRLRVASTLPEVARTLMACRVL